MIQYRQTSNWFYQLTGLVTALFCILSNKVAADTNTANNEAAKVQSYSNAIAIGTIAGMIVLVFLFTAGILVRRRRNSRISPTSRSWKILDDSSSDFYPSKKRGTLSLLSNNFLSTKFTSIDVIAHPGKSYSRNKKESDPYSESYPLRDHGNYFRTQPDQKIPDIPPSLGDIPKLRTDSDTWEKYLSMMNHPGKLNEAVDYMRRTGNSPYVNNSSG